VIGDIVNLASRLESVNKVYGTSIILSEETFRLAQEVIEARELDLITVAGKTEPVRIYEAICRAGELGPELSVLSGVFADGVVAYRLQNWDEAQTNLEKCPRIAAEDFPRASFSNASWSCAMPRPTDWGGVWRFAEK
jgi:adenylate cyclase